jgi:gamma-glutamylcyclotransferase (GGCT)/AIG2-like uncharacterized protein YtfP
MADRLFVYGTLRKDVRNSMFHLLAGEARFVGRARVPGRLLNLGEYPGLVPSTGSGGCVHGEVFALDDAARTLARLDEYERCGPNDPKPHEFERVEVEVLLESGAAVNAWVYVYTGSTTDKQEILSGDYSDEARARRR